jgi:hypothetical protein
MFVVQVACKAHVEKVGFGGAARQTGMFILSQ